MPILALSNRSGLQIGSESAAGHPTLPGNTSHGQGAIWGDPERLYTGIIGFENEVGYIESRKRHIYTDFVLGSVSPPIPDGFFFPKN